MKFRMTLLAAVLCCGVIVGCNTTQQTQAYKTIASIEAAAVAAYDGYCTAVIKGYATTNALPQVSQKFNQIQIACTVAAATSQAGTNALASAQLTSELSDLNALIVSLTATHP